MQSRYEPGTQVTVGQSGDGRYWCLILPDMRAPSDSPIQSLAEKNKKRTCDGALRETGLDALQSDGLVSISRASRRSSSADLASCRSRTSCDRAWRGSHRSGLVNFGFCRSRTFWGLGYFDQRYRPWVPRGAMKRGERKR